MKSISFLILYLTFFILSSFCLAQKPTETNTSKDFTEFLDGVKFAAVLFDDDVQKQIDNDLYPEFVNKIKQYLTDLGFEYVGVKTSETTYIMDNVASACDICFVEFSGQNTNMVNYDISITFTGCEGSAYYFKSDERIPKNNNTKLLEVWYSLYDKKSNKKDKKHRLKLSSNPSEWTENKIKDYLKNSNDIIEGIYERIKFSSEDKEAKYKVGIVNNYSDGYDVIYLDGAKNSEDWVEGEKKAKIIKTAKENFYTVEWLMGFKVLEKDVYAFIDENDLLNFIMPENEDKKGEKIKYLKLFPTYSGDSFSKDENETKSSGSGVILSATGYILTCNHVIENGKKFEIEIEVNGIHESFNSEVVTKDPNNDLAILKINDSRFTSFNSVSFSLSQSSVDVGSNIFALGYPLINTMGKELKVANGIISSKTGFQNAANQYTISVPVQPGNSGGPLFDYNGNLIGVINAKHTGTENVSYAIKINSVLNLLDLVNDKIQIPNFNSLSHNDLPKMVESLRENVVLIKVK